MLLKPLYWLLSLMQTFSYGNCPFRSGESSGPRALRGVGMVFSYQVIRAMITRRGTVGEMAFVIRANVDLGLPSQKVSCL